MAVSIFGDGEITGLDSFSLSQDVLASVPTNGLYLSATNTVGIATNGSGRLFVDSSGLVGIGTNSPTVKLQVLGSAGAGIFIFQPGNDASGYGAFLNAAGTTLSILGNGGGGALTAGATTDFVVRAEANLLFAAGGNNERARIDSSGRLLVGTSSAAGTANTSTNAQIQIEAAATYASQSIRTNSNDATPPYLSFGKSRGTTAGSNTVVANNDYLGFISFDGADGSAQKTGASIFAQVDGTPGANDMPGRLVFSTTADGASSPTERMRIGSDGNIFNQTSGASYYVSLPDNATYYKALSSGSSSGYNQQIYFKKSTGTPDRGIKFATNDNAGSEQVWLELGGNGTFFHGLPTTASAANAFVDSTTNNKLYRSTSSIKYKTDIENIETNYVNNVLKLRPVWYRSLAPGDHSNWSWYGLIAEEVAEIEPRLVHYGYQSDAYIPDEEGNPTSVLKPDAKIVPDGVQYDRISVLLLDLVKRQQQIIGDLQNRFANLEANNADLLARVSVLEQG